jgi:hypothetical protein
MRFQKKKRKRQIKSAHGSLGDNIVVELEDDAAKRGAVGRDVKENAGNFFLVNEPDPK